MALGVCGPLRFPWLLMQICVASMCVDRFISQAHGSHEGSSIFLVVKMIRPPIPSMGLVYLPTFTIKVNQM